MAEPEEDPVIPTNAEDAKRFKAMASVESTTTPSNDDEDTPSANVNQEALGKAMADLSVTNPKKPANTAAAKAPALKVNQEDVSLIVCFFFFLFFSPCLHISIITAIHIITLFISNSYIC